MQHKRPPLPAIILIVLVIAAGIYYGVRTLNGSENGDLSASGTIESVVVNVSPQIAGRVKEVFFDEGQPVTKGAPLFALDESLLAAQREVAQRGVDSAHQALLTAQSAYNLAQAQYEATLTSARAQEGSQRLIDWANRTPGQFDEPLWYFSRDEQIAAAQSAVASSDAALKEAQANLENVVKDLNNVNFVEAETRVANARIEYLISKGVYDRSQLTGGKVRPEDVNVKLDLPPYVPAYRVKIRIAKGLSGDSDVITVANDALDAAEAELEDAQNAYDALLNTDAADRVKEARANVTVAQERYESALDTLSRLQTGENSPQVKIASMALEQSKAALQQAQSAVNQSEANLALLDTQVSELTVSAPMDGTILTRNAEPGEFVQPGAVALAMADLNNITITVYVPEDRYGKLNLGQQAEVTVDSFPGETFNAEVIHISDQAEFTPRNVQTVEGRSSTVYAIKLKVTDSEGKLKIGMPADIMFK